MIEKESKGMRMRMSYFLFCVYLSIRYVMRNNLFFFLRGIHFHVFIKLKNTKFYQCNY